MSDPWAHLAERYEEAYGPKSASPCWPRASALATRVDGPILDLGCGPGYELALFRRGVDYAGGVRIRDADKAMQVIAEGGGTPRLRLAGEFVTFKAR